MRLFIAIARDGHHSKIVAVGPRTAELAAYRIYGESLYHVEEMRELPTFEWLVLVSVLAGAAAGLFFGFSGW